MIGRIANVFRIPEIRQRLWITLAFLLVYRVGSNVPIPGIDLALLHEMNEERGGEWVALLNMLSGGGVNSASLFSLGIMPYISASIIFSLLVTVLPQLEKIAKEGAAGQKRINQWTRLATVPLALVQSVIIVSQVLHVPSHTGQMLLPAGFGMSLTAALTLTAG